MLTQLPQRGCAQAGALLGRAFHDDPLWAEMFPDSNNRGEQLVTMFTGLARATVAAGGIAEATPQIEAVALWMPPHKDIGAWAMVRSAFSLPRFVMSLSSADRKQFTTMLSQIEKRKKALMPRPHWYLSAIGVNPDRQGEGLGSALVMAGLQRADTDRVPTYLETETEGNVSFYRGFGFEVVEELTVTGLGIPVWLMSRPPSSQSAT